MSTQTTSWMFDSAIALKDIESIDWGISAPDQTMIDMESDPGNHLYTDMVQAMLGDYTNQLEAMASVGFNPIPSWMLKGVVLVLNETDESVKTHGNRYLPSPVPSSIINIMLDHGVPVKAVRLVEEKILVNGRNKTITKVVSRDKSGEASHLIVFPSAKRENGKTRMEIPAATVEEFTSLATFADGQVPLSVFIGETECSSFDLGIKNFSSTMSEYTLNQLLKVPFEQAAEFLHIFANKKGSSSWAKHLRSSKKKYGEFVDKVASINLMGYNKTVDIGFKSMTDVRVQVTSSSKGFSNNPALSNVRRIRFNKAMTIDGIVVPAYVAALNWAITMLGGRKQITMRQFTGYEAGSSALWIVEDDTYGRRPEGTETLRLMHDYSCKSLKSGRFHREVSQRYPFYMLRNDSLSLTALKFFVNQGIPAAADKQVTNTVYFGPGAECQGVRIVKKDGKFMVTSLFEVEPPKGNNRLSQAFGGSKADTWDKLRPIVESPLGFETSAGVSKQKGVKVRVLLTNSPVSPNSGPALASKHSFDPITNACTGFALPYAVKRTDSSSISAYQVPKAVENVMRQRCMASEGTEDNWMVYLIPEIENFIRKSGAIGKTFGNGDIVLEMWASRPLHSIPVLNIRSKNQTLRLDKVSVSMDAKYNNRINVDAEFMMLQHDSLVKLRGMGTKSTTLRADYSFHAESDLDKEFVESLNNSYTGPELMFPYETIKSPHAAALTGFVDYMVGELEEHNMLNGSLEHPCILVDGYKLVFNSKEGDGHLTVDLTHPDNEFFMWKQDQTKMVWVEYKTSRSFFESFKAANVDNEELWNSCIKDVVYSEEAHHCEIAGPRVCTAVTFKCYTQVLPCNLYVNVEISTPREQGSRKQSKLAEEMAVTSTINFVEGMNMWRNAEGIRSGIQSVVQMLTDSPTAKVEGRTTVSLFDADDADIVASWIFEDTKEGTKSIKGRQLFQKLDRMFPNGIVFNLEGETSSEERKDLLILPNAMLQIGNFNDGGSAEGLVQDVVNLLYAIAVPLEERGDSWMYALKGHVAKIRASWQTWAGINVENKSTAESPSLLKKAGRSNPLETPCKVMTSFDVFMDHEPDELPILAVHPDDDNVKALLESEAFINRPNPNDPVIVKVSRIPMIMGLKCQLVVTPDAMVAYGMVSPLHWSASNEGDADGDGMSYTACFNDTVKSAMDYNSSINSFQGYFVRYGSRVADTPFADFISLKDAWGKKLQNAVNVGILDGIVKVSSEHKPVISMTTADNWVKFSQDVQLHYQRRVGAGYGCASIASFMLAEIKYRQAVPICSSLVQAGYVKPAEILEADGSKGDKFMAFVGLLFNWIDGYEVPTFASETVPDQDYTWFDWFSSVKTFLNKYERLVNVTWRTTYEDKGLAGFKPISAAFFCALEEAIAANFVSLSNPVIVIENIDYFGIGKNNAHEVICVCSASDVEPAVNQEAINFYDYMHNQHGIDKDLIQDVVNLELLRRAYRRVETRGLNSAIFMYGEEVVNEAIMYGAARRCTQGVPGVEYASERMDRSVSTFTVYPSMPAEYQFSHVLMKEMVGFTVSMHSELKAKSQSEF